MPPRMPPWKKTLLTAVLAAAVGHAAPAFAEVDIPVLVPVTGFLALEGTSQRNGAVLAIRHAADRVRVRSEVIDTGTSPEGAVTALERASGRGKPLAVAASMLGTQMLAMLPLAEEYGIPLVTVSGTASITERGNPWVFRFFPGDEVTKTAHARYVVEELGRRRPAVIYQTTAYGQSGQAHLRDAFAKLGVEPVFEEGVDPGIRDMLPVLTKAMAANPDVLVLHLHSGPTALFVRQAAASASGIPIVAGSAMHQPSTAALLEPAELKGVCAETSASPVSGGSPEIEKFTADYRSSFNTEPDAFALGQYDGIAMVLDAAAKGAATPEDIRDVLSQTTYKGLAMTYRSDGKGNMARSAAIVCYDGASRIPAVAKRYEAVAGQ